MHRRRNGACIDADVDEIQKWKAGRGKTKQDQLVQRPPGLEHESPFEALMEDELEQEVAALDIEVEDQQLAHVVRPRGWCRLAGARSLSIPERRSR